MFDPYHKWLGIPPKDQPPNHYRLLAIDLFESDPEVIDAAANRQMAYVQQRATGEHTAESQKLLNELAAARLCLLDKKKKPAYDLQLKIKVRQEARRGGGGRQDKPPRISETAGITRAESLTGREQAPPVREIEPPPVEEAPAEDSAFVQCLPALRMISLALGGGLLLIAGLLVYRYFVPGREMNPRTVADQAASEHQRGAAKSERPETQPGNAGAAIYNVEIDPPSAALVVQNNMATVTGTGKTREIRFDNVPWHVYPLITASCQGYKSASQKLTPKPGQSENLSIQLEKETPTNNAGANLPPNTNNQSSNTPMKTNRPIDPKALAVPSPSDAGNRPPGDSNNPQPNSPGKTNRPIDPLREHVPNPIEAPRTERRKVYIFSGESAIITPVQRSLPSTVEAWIWYSKPVQNADMYVFGSDDAGKQSAGGLGLRIDNEGQLGGTRMHRNKKLRDIWTGATAPFQKWTHLAATFDKDKICFFVDGHLVHTDKGSQDEGAAKFVVGYIRVDRKNLVNLLNCFAGKMRTVRISTGVRYLDDFRPPLDFDKNQDREGFKTSLIYDASNGVNDRIPDVSGNKKDGIGVNIMIAEEDFPIP